MPHVLLTSNDKVQPSTVVTTLCCLGRELQEKINTTGPSESRRHVWALILESKKKCLGAVFILLLLTRARRISSYKCYRVNSERDTFFDKENILI